MRIIEVILLGALVCLGLIASYTDIKYGLIKNKHIVIFAVMAAVLNTVYYGLYSRDTVLLFLLNALSSILVAVVLFLTNDFAGGDCKLVIAFSLLYPSGMYLTYGNSRVTLFLAIAFAIAYGYIFLLAFSLFRLISGKAKITREYLYANLKTYLKSYIIALMYVTLVNLICKTMSFWGLRITSWIIGLLCLTMAWISTRFTLMRNKYVLISVAVVIVVMSVFLRVIPVSINPRTYLLTLILLLFQLSIRTSIYEEIDSKNVTKGMILSVGSSLLLKAKQINGMPGISSENLKDRLTEDQAATIRNMALAGSVQKTVVIVRKIPFAIFLFLGYLTYFLVWSFVK